MSDKLGIEQALTSLIATLNGPVPPELLDYALSLLARSRSVTHSLKPEEEIARPYACAQIACERLKKRLNLPAIHPRPPSPPRVYKKLYKYLESALPAATSSLNIPRKYTQTPLSLPTTIRSPQPHLDRKKTRGSAIENVRSTEQPPEWTMPTIRSLLKAFSYPAATSNIYTGVESIFSLLVRMTAASAPEVLGQRPRRATAPVHPVCSVVSDIRTLALIAVVLFYVLSRMMDQEITPEQFLEWRDKAVASILASQTGKQSTRDEILNEIEELMPMAQEEGWLQMEWFLNIAPLQHVGELEDVGPTFPSGWIGDEPSVKLKESPGSVYIGLNTMLQDATDYLGQRQREDYQRWKAGVLTRVEEIENVRSP